MNPTSKKMELSINGNDCRGTARRAPTRFVEPGILPANPDLFSGTLCHGRLEAGPT
ncbi:MAG: hypothetical protein LBB76_00350 [Azoarcus sp.]|jgi:hypothetical protein|nr:hypothetical protein [Azoarcus sp.]